MLYKLTCASHQKKKSPKQPNAKKAVHLETPIRHLGGVAENQLACLLWTIKWCASVNTGSLFEPGEGWELGEADLTTPGVSGRMGHVLGPSKHGKFWARWRKVVCQPAFWCVRLCHNFCCYMEFFNEKGIPIHLHIGGGGVHRWVFDAILYAGSYRANAVKMTSSQITCDWFGRAGEGRTSTCFSLTTVTVSQVSLEVSTADCHVQTMKEVVGWWWMYSAGRCSISPLAGGGSHWHTVTCALVSLSSSGSLLGFHPFSLHTLLLKSNKEDFDCCSFLDWRVQA